MGCSTSKLEDEEAVQLCKDRKRFIKQAVEQRSRFASGHLAYIHSLKRVSAALREYVDGDEPREFLLDSFLTTPPFKKSAAPKFITISPNSFTKRNAIQSAASHSTLNVHYLRSGGEQAVSVEERPQSPEIVRVQAYYLRSGGEQAVSVEERPESPEIVRVQAYSPMQYYGFDGFFGVQSSPMNSSFMSYNNGYNMPPPSPPQSSQWDGFWNPFSSLDFYGYAMRSSLDQMVMDDDIRGIRQVREEEGIPDLEDDSEQEVGNNVGNAKDEKQHKVEVNSSNNKEEVLVEDVDEEEEEEDDGDSDCDSGIEFECEGNALKSQCRGEIDLSRAQNSEVCTREMAVGEGEGKVETPGFTVYVNRRPTSMAEVIKDLEEQFTIVCNAAKEVSALLESGRAPHSSNTSELTALKLMNPVALFRSASRSSSSRFLLNSASSKEEDYESSSELSEETSMFSGHKSTLDRLYEWEKRLYEEVRAAEKVRIAYEKKCKQLRNQDINGEDPSAVDKTRAALRDLHTQLKISIHSVEAISKRIETLRDEELQPQLLELLQGMARMWKVMAECHQSQKQTLDQAKLLLAGTPSKLAGKRSSYVSDADPQRLARSASNLETELRNWRSCFEVWITSHRSYMHALAGWLLRCVRCDPDTSKFPFSPRRSSGTFPMLGLCIQWSRFLDSTQEMSVVDGLDFFAAGMGSLYAQQLRDDSQKVPIGSKRYGHESGRNMEIVEFGEVEEVVTKEKMAEVGIRVLCAGMSVAMSSLSEFATRCAEGNAELVKQWENAKLPQNSN